jgi:hypothetical protein
MTDQSEPSPPSQEPAKSDPEIIPVIAVREEGAPPLPLQEPLPDIPFEELEPSPAIVCETIPEPELIDEEIRAAKWYSISFLLVISLLSIVGLAVMIFVTVKMYDAVMQ